MSPVNATCKDCDTQMVGNTLEDTGDLMLAHHHQAHEEGIIGPSSCGVFFIKETNEEGQVIKGTERWLEATMNLIVTPWVGEIVYNPRDRHRGKERQ